MYRIYKEQAWFIVKYNSRKMGFPTTIFGPCTLYMEYHQTDRNYSQRFTLDKHIRVKDVKKSLIGMYKLWGQHQICYNPLD